MGEWEIGLEATIAIATLVLTEVHRMRDKKKVPTDTLEEDMAFIKKDFQLMESFLVDAAEKRRQTAAATTTTSRSLSTWLRHLRGLSQDVEDCLQEFCLHLERPPRAKSKLLLPLDTITKQIRRLRNEIEHVNKSSAIYCNAINFGPDAAQPMSISVPTGPAFTNAPHIGREMEKSHLIQLVSQNSENHNIISIWGMIGIGETSFIRSAYGSEEITSMFEQCAWVTISHPFNLHDFITSLAHELNAHDFSVLGNGLQKSEESIKPSKRRCLLVLDDVLSIEEWNLIQPHLPNETNTKIIVTTREASIAEHCSMTCKNIYKLEGLKEDAAFALFKNKVFVDSSNIDLDLDMITQAKLIIKECDGHPLAITNIAGFLARKQKTTTEWNKLNDNFTSGSVNKENLEMISTTLEPSYNNLSYHLKLCLLYLSVFPKGHNIRRKCIVRRWVAEGYISKTHSLSAEEVGESYFAELINRSIIQPSEPVPAHNVDNIEYCRVHNLMHKISVSKSMEENHGFVLEVSSNNEGTVRHLSIINTGETNKNALKCVDLTHVRSVTIFGECRASLDFSMMRMLRILDLEGTSGLKDRDLSRIGNFLHLRYLSLRGCADIYHLPNSLGNLWDIQMLDVSGTSIIKLPKTITKLKKLHYLRAGHVPKDDATTSSIEMKESSDLSKMGHEPINDLEIPDVEVKSVQFGMTVLDTTKAYITKTMQNNDNVKKHDIFHKYCKVLLPGIPQGLDMYGVKAPEGIGQLNDLNTLGVVNVAAGKVILRELEKLKKLHKLGLTGVNKKNSQAILSAIANLALLHSLSLQAEGEPGLQVFLDHTFAPPSKLQSLKIYRNLVTLPIWITQL
uniref:NB-ARC domain-containing protein n=1 Tax=Oryza glumipatula TaxID=40148 RepID=A0A0D9YS88_9ORYZ